jgi:hypothetical protein
MDTITILVVCAALEQMITSFFISCMCCRIVLKIYSNFYAACEPRRQWQHCDSEPRIGSSIMTVQPEQEVVS